MIDAHIPSTPTRITYTQINAIYMYHTFSLCHSLPTYFRPLKFLTRKNTRFLSLSLSLSLSHAPFESLQSWPDTKQDSTAAQVPRICVCYTHMCVCVLCVSVYTQCLILRICV